MPVLFMTENPLYLEQTSEELRAHPPEWIGAYRSLPEMMGAAQELFYAPPERLAELAARQAMLLEPFRRENVLNEARKVVELLRPPARVETSVPASTQPHAQIPCAGTIELRQKLAGFSGSVPMYSLAAEEQWRLLEHGRNNQPVLRLSAADGSQQFYLNSERSSPAGNYDLELTGRADVGTFVVGMVKMYLPNKKQTSLRIVTAPAADGSFTLQAHVQADQSFKIVLEVQACGPGKVELEEIALTRGAEGAKKVELSSHSDGRAKFKAGEWTPAAYFSGKGEISLRRGGETPEFGLDLCSADGPAKVMFGDCFHPLQVIGFALGLEVEARAEGFLQLELTTRNNSGVVGRSSYEIRLVPGRSFIPISGMVNGDSPAVGSSLYLHAEPACEAHLIALRLVAETGQSPQQRLAARLKRVKKIRLAKKRRLTKARLAAKRRRLNKRRLVLRRRKADQMRQEIREAHNRRGNVLRRLLRRFGA
jgi:hypothetical protein